MSPDIEAVHRLIIDQKASQIFLSFFNLRWFNVKMLNKYKRKYKHATSGVLFLWMKSLFCSQVWNVAKPYIDKYQMEYIPESRPISPTAFSLESPASPRKRCRQEWMVHFFFIIIVGNL